MIYNNVKNGKWCPKCSGHLRKTLIDYQTICKDIGYYLGLKIDDIIYTDKIPEKVNDFNCWWKCKTCNYEWNTSYNNIQQKQGCKKCFGTLKKELIDYINLYENKLEYLGIKINDTFDNTIIPKNTYSNEGFYKCLECDYIYNKSYDSLNQNKKCSNCTGKRKKVLDDYIIACKHKGEYLGLKNDNDEYVLEIPTHTKYKCWWKCYECEYEFESIYNCVNGGNWCPDCAGKRKRTILDYENLPNECNINIEYIGIKNEYGEYILDIPKNLHEKCWWKCKLCDNEFFATYKAIKQGSFCNKCNHSLFGSKIERECKSYLEDNNIEFIEEFRFSNLQNRRFDFVFQYNNKKYVLETDGEQHFKCGWWHKSEEDFLEKQNIDKLKTLIAVNNGFNIIRFYSDDKTTIKEILNYFLNLKIDGLFVGLENENKYSYLKDKLSEKYLLDYNINYSNWNIIYFNK